MYHCTLNLLRTCLDMAIVAIKRNFLGLFLWRFMVCNTSPYFLKCERSLPNSSEGFTDKIMMAIGIPVNLIQLIAMKISESTVQLRNSHQLVAMIFPLSTCSYEYLPIKMLCCSYENFSSWKLWFFTNQSQLTL